MAKTKLSWEDYKQQALKLRSRGLGFPKIYDRLGEPIFNGVAYKIESDGKGGIKRKKRSVRAANRSKATSTRTSNKNLSTPSTVDAQAAKDKAAQIRSQGMEVDHIAELSRTGNALKGMSPERQQQYFSNMGDQVGHQAGNLQALSKQENSQKNIDYRKLDKHLKNMGKNGNGNANGFVNGNGADAAVPNGNGLSNGIPSNGKSAHVIVDSARQVVTVKPAKSFVEIMAMLAKGLA